MKFSKSEPNERQKAIALKYDHEAGKAPLIVAKGMGEIAEQIITLAEEHDIHIHESPELVEVLIRLELGDEIPESLYRAIAEVIAFAYSLKHDTKDFIEKSITEKN
ncbi:MULTISPECIES: EscU/YscU/HrcU family type III secretion system export apparatus switch protein [unclassified Neptuniibacter]|uniref:EscU/YscU/HrcU family type III secretion system export apparatus switch protein n=1 Tax=unclassified Neptuniibacter TaxID=2630693 RepID=UPI000C4E776C|nr:MULTISPECIES: EscU/YscU/HrcU family type III secretion system export apparatus switch protein [unclassified Neptuniibacter]MAY42178.1 flagellar biosynthesis protein FlhB [Oceanospirillaceae bacterium]|tara:strand:+ start:5889 stop:6206 length:318 start_codon:yes stop_codon:yes gene_type:complete